MKGFNALILFSSLFVAQCIGRFASASENATPVAIQERRFNMAHEFRLSLGSMPLDPYQKGWIAGFSYTVHWSDYLAWEVLHANVALLASTDLRDELIDTFAIPEEDFAAPRFAATTGIEFSPIYGKMVFFNSTTIHQAAFIGAHAGFMFGDRATITETLEDFRPAIGVGVGYRLMFNTTTSFRIDFRDFLAFRRPIRTNESVEIENVLLITGALSFNLWRDDA